jgi:hypothetical protein
MIYKTIEDIKREYKIKKHKETSEGYIAIRSKGFWHYFKFYPEKNGYMETGSTLKFEY